MSDDDTGGREIANLLPFYATGAIDRREKARVAIALASDAAMQRELAVILEERQTVIEVNESLGAPSRQARDRFFAMLEKEPARPRTAAFDPAAWIAARLDGLRPRTLAWASVAAVLVVVFQAVVIGLMMAPKTGFETASVAPGSAGPADGALLVVAFAPDAKAADIAQLLEEVKGTIVAGPLPGGLFKMRVGGRPLNDTERRKIIATLASRPAVVRFAAPSDEAE